MAAKRAKSTTKKATAGILPKEPEEHKSKPPVMAQMVVEVEDEGKAGIPVGKLENDVKAVETATEKLEADIDQELEKEAAKSEEQTVAAAQSLVEEAKDKAEADLPKEKQKEAVREFFRPENRGVAPEIAAYQGDGGSKSIFLWIAIIFVVALLTGGGLMIAVRGMPALPFLAAKPTPTPTPMPTPPPTPTPSVNRADLKLQVLNGGGVVGAGSKMKSFLEGKGYKVENVGNASNYSYESTQILVKPGKEEFLSLLESDLKTDYTLGTASATLPDDNSYDAQVIVGKE